MSAFDIDLALKDGERRTLDELFRAIKSHPEVGAEIIGFADERECKARDCENLALARSRLVFEWMAIRGLPLRQLRGPIEESTRFPMTGLMETEASIVECNSNRSMRGGRKTVSSRP